MTTVINNTNLAVAVSIALDLEATEVCVVAVKGTWRWEAGTLASAAPDRFIGADQYSGDETTTGLLLANELGPPKAAVDVLLTGDVVAAHSSAQIDCRLEVGKSIAKTVRVFGDRVWLPGVVRQVVPSKPRPFLRMPICWERAFGGTDPGESGAREARNPAGCGFSKTGRQLEGRPLPNFEDPAALLTGPRDRPAPHAFGPIAAHWDLRRGWAGTYDEAWQSRRWPRLPLDFDRKFFNVAPLDQQMPTYRPGDAVTLTGFTPHHQERFALPVCAPLLTVVDGRHRVTLTPLVDTVTVYPDRQILTVVARTAYRPSVSVTDLSRLVVGELTPGQARALTTGKPYLRLRGGALLEQ